MYGGECDASYENGVYSTVVQHQQIVVRSVHKLVSKERGPFFTLGV